MVKQNNALETLKEILPYSPCKVPIGEGLYFGSLNTTFLPTIEDDHYLTFIYGQEAGHQLVDMLTHFGRCRYQLNVDKNIIFLFAHNIRHRRNIEDLMGDVVVLKGIIECLNQTSYVFNETFSILFGYYWLLNDGVDEKNINRMLRNTFDCDEYSICEGPFRFCELIINKYGITEGFNLLYNLFLYAGHINIYMAGEDKFHLPTRLNDSPDYRLMVLVDYCKKEMNRNPNIDVYELYSKMARYVYQRLFYLKAHRDSKLDFFDMTNRFNDIKKVYQSKDPLYEGEHEIMELWFNTILEYYDNAIKYAPLLENVPRTQLDDDSTLKKLLKSFPSSWLLNLNEDGDLVFGESKTTISEEEAIFWVKNLRFTVLANATISGKKQCIKTLIKNYNCGRLLTHDIPSPLDCDLFQSTVNSKPLGQIIQRAIIKQIEINKFETRRMLNDFNIMSLIKR